jgi:hypothetical protein
MKATKATARPKWAKKIPARLWRDLAKCQGRTPSLARLRADVAQQTAAGRVGHCDVCSTALRLAEGAE